MRLAVFDLLRFFLIVLVVNLHLRIIMNISSGNFLEPLIWYSVPLFIILSFYFWKNNSLVRRLKRLIIPFLFWSIIGFIAKPQLLNLQNIAVQLITGQLVNTPLYFLVLLIFFTLIVTLISKLTLRLKVSLYFFIIILAFALEYSKINYQFFSQWPPVFFRTYGRFFELIKYVPVGMAFAYLSKKVIDKKIFLYLTGVLVVDFSFISFFSQPPGFHFSGLNIFFGTSALFSLIIWLSQFKLPVIIGRLTDFLGQYSFGVFLIHYPLFQIIVKIFHLPQSLFINHSLIFLLVYVPLCYTFCYIADLLTGKRFSFLIK